MSTSSTPTDKINMQPLKEDTQAAKSLKDDAGDLEVSDEVHSGEICDPKVKDDTNSNDNPIKNCQHAECLGDACSKQVIDNQPEPSPESSGSDSELSATEESVDDWASSDDEATNSETISQLIGLHKRQLAMQRERMELEQKFYKRKLELQKERFEMEKKKLKLEYNCMRELLTLKQEMRQKIAQYESEKIADRINNNS